MLRTGQQYLEAINDGREVFLGGERVKEVTEHRAFRSATRSMAGLYDLTSNPDNAEQLTYVEEETGERCNSIFLRPRSIADLAARRRVHEALASNALDPRAPFVDATFNASSDRSESVRHRS